MTRRSRILFYLVAVIFLLQVFTNVVVADEFDEEELVNSPESEPVPYQETLSEPVQEPKPLETPSRPKLKISDFYPEIFMIVCMIVYLINYFIGSQANERIARKWIGAHISLFRDNFSLVGIGNGDSRPILVKDGPADYIFYLSGRRYCQFVHGRITLKPRHNLVQVITNIIISQFSSKIIEDSVTFNVYMNGGDYDNFVFAITKKERSGEFRAARYDLSDFTKQVNNNLLPGSFHVQTESSDITDTFLTKQVVELLKKSEAYLNAIIVTDQPRVRPEKVVNHPKLLTVVCTIPDDLSKADDTLSVSELAMYLIDFIPTRCSFRLETKNKLKKNREESEKIINKGLEAERQEVIQQKKAEKKRAEAERVAKLSPEEQRKHEERERKRELKKKQKKLIKKHNMTCLSSC